jgi:hypothetical protein
VTKTTSHTCELSGLTWIICAAATPCPDALAGETMIGGEEIRYSAVVCSIEQNACAAELAFRIDDLHADLHLLQSAIRNPQSAIKYSAIQI